MNRSGPRRIVSLVPSLTEALFALGLGDRVVGITDWCVHPARELRGLPRVGGTKTPDLAAIRELAPDLVIANREENRRVHVERLRAEGLEVWVTYPRTVSEGVEVLRELAALGAATADAERVLAPVEAALREAQEHPVRSPSRVFCPVWRDPWMAVGRDTYANDMLTLCGGANVFASRPERRYPVVGLGEVERADPEVILLPDEPYAFGPEDARELAKLDAAAARQGRIHLLEGTLLTWYGPRIARAIEELRPLLAVQP